MELHKLHVLKLSAGFVCQRHSVAGILPGVGGYAVCFADAASGHDHCFRFQDDKASLLAPVSERPGDAVAIFQQADDGALHEGVKAHGHAAVLKGANHLQAGAVTHMAKTFEGVSAESALQNVAIACTVKKRAPLLQFAHAVWSFLGMKLGHAPVVEQLASA